MHQKLVLFADNDPDFLQTRAEFLQNEGYHIVFANSPVEAERLLNDVRVHLAILDVRLSDDDDEKDISGELLAQKVEFRNIPKIMLTGKPSPYTSRDSLRQHPSGFYPAINYLIKEEGPQVLITAVNDAFTRYIRINWDLRIEWKTEDALSLIRQIEPTIEGERRQNYALEFEDLFRRLFYEKDYIRIDHRIWQCDSRLAMVVFAFKEGMKSESFVVVCGNNHIIKEEARRFDEFAPKVAGDSSTTLNEKMRAETTHFGANAYILANNDLENIQTLEELYRHGPEKTFNIAVGSLYQKVLKAWHQEKPIPEVSTTLDTSYRKLLNLTNDLTQQHIEERIEVIKTKIPSLGVRIELADDVLAIHFVGQSFTYPNPTSVIAKSTGMGQPTLLVTVPGTLSGNNILTDTSGRTWLTDFAEGGIAPILWNYVILEAAIRFDWVETKELQRRYELEYSLIFNDFAKNDIKNLEPVIRKPARAIQIIRKLASRTVGGDIMAYHFGIFYHAVRRLAELNPTYPLISTELARLGQVLFSIAMFAKKWHQDESILPLATNRNKAVRILDEKARTILVGNRQRRIAPKPFALFKYLYDRANQVCTKEELLKIALQDMYDDGNLQTLISRIRKEIEDDPEHPRYLINEPYAGYRLILNPK